MILDARVGPLSIGKSFEALGFFPVCCAEASDFNASLVKADGALQEVEVALQAHISHQSV